MQNINGSSKAMGFFDLSQELRDRVYMIILESEIKPPQHPIQGKDKNRDSKNAYEVQPHEIASFGLLYTCRQTRYEMSQAITRQNATKKGITYQLDCLLDQLNCLLDFPIVIPTWTALPAPPCHLRRIIVTVRTVKPVPTGYIRSEIIDILYQPLLTLVNQFFDRDYVWWGQRCNIPLTVDKLKVHIPSHDISIGFNFWDRASSTGGRGGKVKALTLRTWADAQAAGDSVQEFKRALGSLD